MTTELEFDRAWGLGSSSTLIFCLAQWAEVDPFKLLFNTINGSGMDVACADANGPIMYHIEDEQPLVESVVFDPKFKDELYLVHRGRKQDTSASVKKYLEQDEPDAKLINEVTQLSRSFVQAKTLKDFEAVMEDHERLISNITGFKRQLSEQFDGYWGKMKSLGAWGGDFILATSDRGTKETTAYFNEKGSNVVIPFTELAYVQS